MNTIKLVSTLDVEKDEWLEWRKKGLGGSDIAAICGMSSYSSPMKVYLDKVGELPPLEDNPKMKAGRILEPVIADWFKEEIGKRVRKENFILQHPKHPFMLANIDRWIIGENAGLEIKNSSEYMKDDWSEERIPKEYIFQCNHYMACSGAERWYVGVLLGGWDFQWRVIERDEELINNIIEIEYDFWHNHVLANVPPAFSHQDTELLKDQYPDSNGEDIELPESSFNTIQDLHQARIDLKSAEEKEETAKNNIKGMMGEAERAFYQGELKFTWKTGKKNRSFRVIGGEL